MIDTKIDTKDVMTKNGIRFVLIIDDDAKENFTIKKLELGGFKEILEQLEDDTNQDTKKIINILKSKGKETELQDLVNFIFTSHNSVIPEFYQKKLLNPAKERFTEMFQKIKIIKDCLISLGIQESEIRLAINKEEAKKNIDSDTPPDLILIDYRLEDEGSNSITFVEELINIIKEKKKLTQFILMSYDSDGLKNQFRRLHKENKISSSRFKVIKKPSLDGDLAEKINWQLALIQIAYEKRFMEEQEHMQIELARYIKEASEKLTEKIWEIDACCLNQLRLTAQEDHISLQKYLLELMSKNLLAEYEEQIAENDSIEKLEQALKAVKHNNLIFSSSPEIIDPYEKLKVLLADLIAIRYKSIKQPPKNSNKMEVDKLNYVKYLEYINFGTILKDTTNNQHYVNLTMPCDYIHSKFSDIASEKFILIPGKEYNPLTSFSINNKEFKSQHLNIQDRIGSLKWELRKPEMMVIKSVLDKLIKNELTIVGQLRQEQAQAIITKFATNISRVGLPRTPIFEDSKITCYIRDSEKGLNWEKELTKATQNPEFTGRRYYNKNNMNIVFSREESISIIQKFGIFPTGQELEIFLKLMNGITLKKDELSSTIDDEILVFTFNDLKKLKENTPDTLNKYSYYLVIGK
ncbi:hypothetical protein [Gilliamella sp. BG1]|uniref:hypothetical protein n=1 Tax=Gilliamella sp. BG1 TaxID=3351508 RepID=UPI003987264B